MGHKTLINGSQKEITSGKSLIQGVSMAITKGKTLIGGTAKEINFGGRMPIGGRIFYIGSSNGAIYKFYDASGRELTTHTVSGLAEAAYYSIQGLPSKDRFYAYCTEDGLPTGNILVGRYKWSASLTNFGVTTNTIGSGKTNSAILVNRQGDTSGTIWNWIKNTLNALVKNGCNDWFVGSMAEMDALRNSGTPAASIFESSNSLWASVESDENNAKVWSYNSTFGYSWLNSSKNVNNNCVCFRSF